MHSGSHMAHPVSNAHLHQNYFSSIIQTYSPLDISSSLMLFIATIGIVFLFFHWPFINSIVDHIALDLPSINSPHIHIHGNPTYFTIIFLHIDLMHHQPFSTISPKTSSPIVGAISLNK